MKGQQYQINTERSTFIFCVHGQTGGQIKALLVGINLNTSVSP